MTTRSSDRRQSRRAKARNRWPAPRNEKTRPGGIRSGLERGDQQAYSVGRPRRVVETPRD